MLTDAYRTDSTVFCQAQRGTFRARSSKRLSCRWSSPREEVERSGGLTLTDRKKGKCETRGRSVWAVKMNRRGLHLPRRSVFLHPGKKNRGFITSGFTQLGEE